MPTTSPDNLYYPDENTDIAPLEAVLAAMQTSNQNAVNKIRTDLAPQIISDSGWTLAGLSVAAGFSGLSDSQGRATGIKGGMRKWGPLVELRFRVTKGTGTITAGSPTSTQPGNIGDVTIATITNTAYRPAGAVYFMYDYGPGLGSGAGRIGSDGVIAITDFYPSGKIEAGKQIQVDAVFFTG